MAHRDVVIAVHSKVAELIKQGKTQEEVMAAKPAAEFASRSRKWVRRRTALSARSTRS